MSSSNSQPTKLRLTLWIALAFGFFNLIVRVFPELHNTLGILSPMMALCLFGAARFSQGKLIWVIALGSFLLGDLVVLTMIGLRDGWSEAFANRFYSGFYLVYAAFAIAILIGGLLRKTNGVLPILGAGIAAEGVFFLITNFASWLALQGLPPFYYTMEISSLMAAFVNGLPFFGKSLLSTLIYGGILFGGWAFISSRAAAGQRAGAQA